MKIRTELISLPYSNERDYNHTKFWHGTTPIAVLDAEHNTLNL